MGIGTMAIVLILLVPAVQAATLLPNTPPPTRSMCPPKNAAGVVLPATAGQSIFACLTTNQTTKACVTAECRTPSEQSEVGKSPNLATSIDEVEDAQTLLQNVVGWIQVFFYIIATLMIILAAWDYLNSHGSEDKVKEAKQRVIYAIIAIAIAVVAGGVVQLVKNFVG